jgi:hypothetical protein
MIGERVIIESMDNLILELFQREISTWARLQADILAVALVGS